MAFLYGVRITHTCAQARSIKPVLVNVSGNSDIGYGLEVRAVPALLPHPSHPLFLYRIALIAAPPLPCVRFYSASIGSHGPVSNTYELQMSRSTVSRFEQMFGKVNNEILTPGHSFVVLNSLNLDPSTDQDMRHQTWSLLDVRNPNSTCVLWRRRDLRVCRWRPDHAIQIHRSDDVSICVRVMCIICCGVGLRFCACVLSDRTTHRLCMSAACRTISTP